MEQASSLILSVISNPVTHVIFGALLGFLASTHIENKRQKNLRSSLYQEISRINEPLKSYLIILLKQFTHPKQEILEGTKPIYLNFLEPIIIELMSTKNPLNSDQLDLIHNLKTKIYHFEKSYQNRDEKASAQILQDNVRFFRLNPNETAKLVSDCIEMIYFLDLFCSQKEKFIFSQQTTFQEQYQKAFSLSDIEYDGETYCKVTSCLKNLGKTF